MERVGVRELRQNLSVYLRRVQTGDSLTVTEHGHPVAVLGPLPPPRTVLEQMIADGTATPATMQIRDLPPPVTLPPGQPTASEVLEELRRESR